MRILIIFTGGTIGSCLKNEWIAIDDSSRYLLLQNYTDKDDTFEIASPYSILSENLSFSEVNMLQKEIKSSLGKGYDGIIVTHGTDTLQYAACAAEYAFSDSDIPIVFVSSNYPLESENTNGYINFEAAVEFIRSKISGGVFVSYKNDDSDCTDIHIPSRILSHGECCADIHSIDQQIFASYKDGSFILKNEAASAPHPLGVVDYCENSGILCIDSHPSNDYSYSLDGVGAVILKPFHSATLATANKKLAQFCNAATDRKIPVFLVNVRGGSSYESSKEFESLGIKVLPYSTFISAYMKIWAGISLGEDLGSFVLKPVSGEFIQ